MSRYRRAVRALAVVVVAAVTGLVTAGPVTAGPVAAQNGEPGIWLTDADGAPLSEGSLFGDEQLVPGHQLDASFLVHHRGDVDGPVELRAEALSDPDAFSDDVVLTLRTTDEATKLPLTQLLREATVIHLGGQPAEGVLPVDLTVSGGGGAAPPPPRHPRAGRHLRAPRHGLRPGPPRAGCGGAPRHRCRRLRRRRARRRAAGARRRGRPGASGPSAGMTDDDASTADRSTAARWGRRLCKVAVSALLLVSLAVILAFVVVPRLSGATPYTVLTGSMSPDMPAGSIAVVKEVPFEDIRVGDVVTYQLRSGEATVVTHRVVGIDVVADGETRLRTQGDANASADPERVRAEQVRGTVWYHAPYVGYLSAAISPDTRAWAARLVGVGLLGFAGYLVISAVRGRGRQSDP